MGINADPNYVNYGGPYLEIPPAIITNVPTKDSSAGLSTLAQSQNKALVIEFMASMPSLNVTTGRSLYSDAARVMSVDNLAKIGSALVKTYNDTMNAILDSWTKSIQQQKEISHEAAIKENIKHQTLEYQRNQENIKREYVQSDNVNVNANAPAQPSNFVAYWNNSSPQEKVSFNESFGAQAVNAYYASLNTPAAQNDDIRKLTPIITPLFTKEAFEVNPLALDITLRGSGMGELFAGLAGVSMLQAIPQINMMLAIPLVSTAVEASIGLFGKKKNPPKNKIDQQFVEEFAKKILAKTNNIGKSIQYSNPNYLLLDGSQRNAVNLGCNLVALTTVLMLDVKSQARFSNLSPEEFASLLKNGIPENDLLNQVVQKINQLLSMISDKTQASQFVSFLLDYIANSAKSTIATLKGFANTLAYASQEIGPEVRAVNSPD